MIIFILSNTMLNCHVKVKPAVTFSPTISVTVGLTLSFVNYPTLDLMVSLTIGPAVSPIVQSDI